jgi:hypothetical protein
MLIAALPELGKLNRREIAALAGVAPWDRKSGKYDGKAHIFGGRKDVRCAALHGRLFGLPMQPTLHAFAQRLKQQGKSLQSRADRLYAEIADNTQCHDEESNAMDSKINLKKSLKSRHSRSVVKIIQDENGLRLTASCASGGGWCGIGSVLFWRWCFEWPRSCGGVFCVGLSGGFRRSSNRPS